MTMRKKQQKPPVETGPRVSGENVVMKPLDEVSPNSWNPNVVPPEMMASIRHGMTADGWLMSQPLLIWGEDEVGAYRGVIIDGEHRWRSARDLGFESGPMVFLNGITERQARALTIKMNQKRGDWSKPRLQELLKDLTEGLDLAVPDISLDLGFSENEMSRLLGLAASVQTPEVPPVELPSPMADMESDATPASDSTSPRGDVADEADKAFTIESAKRRYQCPACGHAWNSKGEL